MFGLYCAYLTSIEPVRENILYISWDYMRPELDSLNRTQYFAVFNETEFQENYTVEWRQGQYGDEFVITPHSNPDIEILLNHDGEDYYLMAIGYGESDPLPGNENYRILGEETADELSIFLKYLGHTVNPDALYWDDYFSFPNIERAVVLFGLLDLIIIYSFMMVYRKSWLLSNMKTVVTNSELVLGLAIMLASSCMFLLNIWYSSAGPDFFLSCNCFVLYGMFFILGFYAITQGIKKVISTPTPSP
jgi:hypothetical protein